MYLPLAPPPIGGGVHLYDRAIKVGVKFHVHRAHLEKRHRANFSVLLHSKKQQTFLICCLMCRQDIDFLHGAVRKIASFV